MPRFTPERKIPFPLYGRLDGPQGRSGRTLKISPFCLYLQQTTQTFMPPAVFEPATPASDRLQTLTSDRSVTGIGKDSIPGRAARSEWLYRLSYPGSRLLWCRKRISNQQVGCCILVYANPGGGGETPGTVFVNCYHLLCFLSCCLGFSTLILAGSRGGLRMIDPCTRA
jgi:hypothetical protein